MKCKICNEKIEETFLKKLVGTYVKKDGKKKPVCSNCQSKLTMEEIQEKL